MKNSLFKRAVAAAAAVPLALTQCLTYSFAAQEEADNNDVAVISTADSASSNSFTLQNILEIAPDKTESEWNLRISSAIDQLIADGKTSGTIGKQAVVDAIVKNAGKYSEMAEALLGQVGDINYTIGEDKNITVTVDVANVSEALQGDFRFSLGRLNKKLVENYGDPALGNIDYTSVKAGGTFTLVINTSELAADTTVSATLKLTDGIGNTYETSDAILSWVNEKIQDYKAVAIKAINDSTVLSDKKKADAVENVKADISKYEKVVTFSTDKINKFLNYSNTASSVAELIAYADGYAARYTKRDLPESATEAVSKELAKSLYAEAQDAFNTAAAPYTLDIDLDEVADFVDNGLRNVKASADNGNLYFYGEFDDAEAEQVAAWYAENVADKEYVSSYKFIEIKADGTKANELTGSADLKIKRVVTTKDKNEETTTTTSDTTTTTSDTTSTTSDTTSTTSDTTSTTSDTTSTTSDTTTTSTDVTTTTTTGATVADVYVDYEADYGFYTSQDAAFSADQVSSFKVFATYDQYYLTEAGMKVAVGTTDPVEISGAKFTFAATPAETYSTETFKHDIALVAAEDITDEAGNVLVKAGEGFKTLAKKDVTVEVYVGLKGDTNLDNSITAVDATYVLVYYANLSAGNVDSNKVRLSLANELAEDPSGIYDNFAAFLADVSNEIPATDAWAVGKVSRKDANVQRSVTAVDASKILVFYSQISDGTDAATAWAYVLGK